MRVWEGSMRVRNWCYWKTSSRRVRIQRGEHTCLALRPEPGEVSSASVAELSLVALSSNVAVVVSEVRRHCQVPDAWRRVLKPSVAGDVSHLM